MPIDYYFTQKKRNNLSAIIMEPQIATLSFSRTNVEPQIATIQLVGHSRQTTRPTFVRVGHNNGIINEIHPDANCFVLDVRNIIHNDGRFTRNDGQRITMDNYFNALHPVLGMIFDIRGSGSYATIVFVFHACYGYRLVRSMIQTICEQTNDIHYGLINSMYFYEYLGQRRNGDDVTAIYIAGRFERSIIVSNDNFENDVDFIPPNESEMVLIQTF